MHGGEGPKGGQRKKKPQDAREGSTRNRETKVGAGRTGVEREGGGDTAGKG